MGSRGPMPKPADRVLGHRKRKTREVVEAESAAPAAPEEWVEATKDAWRIYWASDLAKVTIEVDRPSIRRLFALYDQYERSMDVVRRALVVKGSTGQIRTNPLADHALKLEGVILRLENELGLTPMARIRLGIQLSRPTPLASLPGTERSDAGPYAGLRVVND